MKSYASTHSNRLYRFLNPNDRKITIILPKFSLIGPFHNSVCRRFRNSHKGNMTQNIRLRIRSCMTQKKSSVSGLVRIFTLLNILKDTEPFFRIRPCRTQNLNSVSGHISFVWNNSTLDASRRYSQLPTPPLPDFDYITLKNFS